MPDAEAAVRALFSDSNTPRPTAICCISDEMAMVAMRAIRSLGLSVPRDVSVVGWLNAGAAEYADPALTSVAEPLEEMGRRLVQLLLARNATQLALEQAAQAPATRAKARRSDASESEFEDSPQREALPMELVARDSTAPPPTR
jgi:DNA-binding LacI/PurR family transcriptional regulator